MNPALKLALDFTLRWEGGFVDHPDDPGGATNHGVSLRWLKGLEVSIADIDGDGDVDAEDIRALTIDQARDLFADRFWHGLSLDEFPPAVSIAVFDAAVNSGPRPAFRFLQRALNLCGSTLEEDGIFGPASRAELVRHAMPPNGPLLLVNGVNWARIKLMTTLAQRKNEAGRQPMQVFLPGWTNRVHALTEEIWRM